MIYFNKLIQLQRGCCGFSHLHPTFCNFIIHDGKPKINKKILIFCGQFLYISAEKRHDYSLSGCPDGQCVTDCPGQITVYRSVAAKPPCLPLWGRCPQNFHILWAERAVLQLLPSQSRLTACQLSQRESQGCGTMNSILTAAGSNRVVLRGANQNDNDCRRQSYRNFWARWRTDYCRRGAIDKNIP